MHWLDPDSLPEIRGVTERFLLNPHGEADGMIFADGTEVHFPPHMAKDVVEQIQRHPQGEVRVRGVRPRDAQIFAAVSVQTEGGPRIEDRGPPPKPEKPARRREGQPSSAEGVVRQVLHGPKGERRGLLLDSGVSLRFPPHAAADVAEWLRPGAAVAAEGHGLETPLGTVIDVQRLGARGQALKSLAAPRKAPPNKPVPHRSRPR
jgi:hypothetical protein